MDCLTLKILIIVFCFFVESSFLLIEVVWLVEKEIIQMPEFIYFCLVKQSNIVVIVTNVASEQW